MRTNNRIAWLLWIGMVWPSLLTAQSFSGRIFTSFFTYERSDTVGQSSQQARGYQGFQLDFRNRHLLFRAFGQLDHDFASPLTDDPRIRMYNFYLQWQTFARRAELKLGRQPVFSGVAVGTIDGAQFTVRFGRLIRIKAFAGTLMPASQQMKIISDAKSNYLAGGQIRIRPVSNLYFSLSYFTKQQTRPGYNTLRADSIGNVFTQFIQPTTRAFQMAAFDGTWQIRTGTSLYSRMDFDIYGQRITRGEVALQTRTSDRLSLNAAYTYRSPRLPWNSIFSVFNTEKNHEIEAGFYYQVHPQFQLQGNGALILYTDDRSLRLSVGANTAWGSFNYVHRSGYAGELDGLNAYFYRALWRNRLLPNVQLSWASYRLDRNAKRTPLLSAALGLLYRPAHPWSLDSQLQILRNKFYDLDTRLLLRFQYWFFNSLSAKSAENEL